MKKVRADAEPVRQNKKNGVEDLSTTSFFARKPLESRSFGLSRMRIAILPSSESPGCWRCSVWCGDMIRTILWCWCRRKRIWWDDSFRAQKSFWNKGEPFRGPHRLSPRQTEILLSVIRNRANKEIASRLNITVRTVKFHISSLLNKFGVDNRADLARRAAALVKPGVEDTEGLAFVMPNRESESSNPRPIPLDRTPAVAMKARAVRFAGRQLSA